MSFRDLIIDVTEDLTTLEVATLTRECERLELEKEPNPDDPKLKTLNKRVTDAQAALLKTLEEATSEDNADSRKETRKKIRGKKRVLREAQKQLNEGKKALGISNPKDIFSKIRLKLPQADLVAYSRFELEGDSTNFINNHPSVQNLVNRHDFMIAASQEARKSLFATVLKLDKDDQAGS